MCEKENNTKVQKPKISEITRWAFGFAISQTFLIIFPIFSHILGFDFDPVLCLIMALLFAPISFVLGVIGVFKIKKSKGRLKGLWFAIVGIVVAIITIALFICILIQIRKMAYLKMCENNLSGLGKAISVYAQDNNGKYPLAESWCDLLVEHTDVTEGYFVCKGGGKGRGYYANQGDGAGVGSAQHCGQRRCSRFYGDTRQPASSRGDSGWYQVRQGDNGTRPSGPYV